MSKNVNIYKRLKTIEQARIIYNSFHGIAHRLEKGRLKPIVIIQIPDTTGCVCENVDGDEIFLEIRDIFIAEKIFEEIKDK